MSLKAGRVGVNPADVDPITGKINPTSIEGYTKSQADAKFATKEALADSQTTTISLLNDTVGWVGYNLAESFAPNTYKTQWYDALYIEAELEPNTEYVVSFDNNNGNVYQTNSNLFTSAVNVTADGKKSVKLTTASSISKSTSSQYESGYGWRVFKNVQQQSEFPAFSDVMIYKAEYGSNLPFEPYHPPVSELLIQLTTDMLTGSQLKAVVADSSDFADFKTKVAEM